MDALRAVALSLLTGALFALSLPPYDHAWLAWAAFAPLLFAAARPGRRPLHAFGLGMLASVTAGAVHVRWHESADGLRYAYLPFLWLGLVLGTVGAAAAWYRGRTPDAAPGPRWVLLVACAGVAAEWATTFSPLPVGVALTQYRTLPVLQVAAFAGMWGVSLLLYLADAAVAAALASRRWQPLAAAASVVLFAHVAGAAELRRVVGLPQTSLGIAAVQEYSEAEAGRYQTVPAPDDAGEEALLERAATTGDARLVVGSEEGLAAGFHPEDPRDPTIALAKRTNRALVVGYQERGDPKDFNCAAVVDGEGTPRSVHRKIKLFLGERAGIQAGERATVADVPFGNRFVKVGTLICFDTCYPAIVREEARQGAQIVAVPNYDPPVPGMVLHHLHAALMPFRAVENRVALVRADPNGKSMVVSPSGAIVAEAPLFHSQVLTAGVPLGDGRGTPYARWGDWLAYLCAGGAVSLSLARPRRTEAT